MSDDSKRLPHASSNGGVIELNVGGHHYTTSLATLSADRESMLAIMFRDDQMPTATDADGRIFIDRDGTHFGVILNYLRDLQTPSGVSPDVRRALQAEARFFHIAGLMEWAMKVDDELREAEAAAADIAVTYAERITSNLGRHLEILCGLLQHINFVEWAQQARTLSRDALLHAGSSLMDLAGRFLRILPQIILVFGSLPLCLILLLRADHESGPMSINVGGQLITATRSTLSGNRYAARVAETPFTRGEEHLYPDDFIFTGRLYCFANELFAPRWQFLTSHRCNFWVRNVQWESIDQRVVSLRSKGEVMGPDEFHAISKCWCAMKQSEPVRDTRGNIFLDRDPSLMSEIVRALRYPEDAIQALRFPGNARNSRFQLSSRAAFCKEASYYGIVDFVASCREPSDYSSSDHKSASTLLAFDMLKLSLKDLEIDWQGLTEVDIPLEQVVHNRLHNRISLHNGVSKQLDNPITESKKRLQADLESLLKNLLMSATFLANAFFVVWAHATCRPLLAAVRYAYLRLVLSPMLGFLIISVIFVKEYYFSDRGPEDFAGWFCKLPRKCRSQSHVEQLLLHLRAYHALDAYRSKHLQQSHVCDKTLDFFSNLAHIYQYLREPLLLFSVGAILCYLCGLKGEFVENIRIARFGLRRFRGMLASWTVWIMRSMAFGLPCFIALLGLVGSGDSFNSPDGRRIHVLHPAVSLDDLWDFVTEHIHAQGRILSKVVVDVIYKNEL